MYEAHVKDDEIDEKVQRRRLQYKVHQRRHRAKQKEKVARLEVEVQSLTAQVDTLDHERQKFRIQHSHFLSRSTVGGRPGRVVMEFFRLFQANAISAHLDQQEQFLRSFMTMDTMGPDYKGVDTVVAQWRRFCIVFAYMRYEALSIDISTADELTLIAVDSIFSIGARRDGIVTLYPSLNGDMELTQKLSGTIIDIRVKYYFTFDGYGTITWFSAEWNLVDALQRVLADLAEVSTVLTDANISTSTGQIKVEKVRASEIKPATDPRYNVEFLLS